MFCGVAHGPGDSLRTPNVLLPSGDHDSTEVFQEEQNLANLLLSGEDLGEAIDQSFDAFKALLDDDRLAFLRVSKNLIFAKLGVIPRLITDHKLV